MKLITISVLALLGCQIHAYAQKLVFYLNFDDFKVKEETTHKDSARYVSDLQQSQYAKGLSGKALDLSANAILRRPVKLNKEDLPEFSKKNFVFCTNLGKDYP